MNYANKLGTGRNENRVPLYSVVPLKMPFSIGLYVSDFCNFRCVYCGQSVDGTIKKKSMVTWEDFMVWANQIEEFIAYSDGILPKNIRFTGYGEPLTNPILPKIIEYLSTHHYSDRLEITTNASLLTHEMSRKLIEAGTTRLLVSVQGTSNEKYKKICGYDMDVEKFIENISYFYEHRNQCKVYIKIVDIALDDEEDKQRFYEMFAPVCDMVNVENITRDFNGVDYSSIRSGDGNQRARYGYESCSRVCCDALFMYMNIQPNGDVSCCGCVYPPLLVGNLYKTPLKDLWNGDVHKGYMKQHLNRKGSDIKNCNHCDYLKHNGHPTDILDDHLTEILGRIE